MIFVKYCHVAMSRLYVNKFYSFEFVIYIKSYNILLVTVYVVSEYFSGDVNMI